MSDPFEDTEFVFTEGKGDMVCSKEYCKNSIKESNLYGVEIGDREIILCHTCFIQYVNFIEIYGGGE